MILEVIIKHDPNTKVTYMTINGFNVSMVPESYGYGKIKRMLEKKTPIADWVGANGDWGGILNEVVQACNICQIEFLFTGSRKDFEILKNSCEKQNNERAMHCDISYELECEISFGSVISHSSSYDISYELECEITDPNEISHSSSYDISQCIARSLFCFSHEFLRISKSFLLPVNRNSI